MAKGRPIILLFVLMCWRFAYALEPNEILVVANRDCTASIRLARYYCEKRGLPSGYVIPVALGASPRDSIGRNDYNRLLARPIHRLFSTREDLKHIKCLVTTYGIPFRVGPRAPLADSEGRLKELRGFVQREQDAISKLKAAGQTDSAEFRQRQQHLSLLRMDIDRIMGKETEASVDSELSLVLAGRYELYRWQPNRLRDDGPQPFRTLMVCRLDGPNHWIAQGLIDKALAAEEKGLVGTAYIDSRGLYQRKDMYAYYDQSLRDLALLTQLRTNLPVQEEQTQGLFAPGTCPETALYCGWYSLKKYVDAFDFVDGAIGFHIASLEAVNLRDAQSTQWCPAMLMDGVTATLGSVAEPYLHAFPEPKKFFAELFDGSCLVEAYYRTKPFNSWQMVLIGDPLYRPFPHGSSADG